MKYNIIVDSSCDLESNYFATSYNDSAVGLSVVPFIIRLNEVDFVDDASLEYNKFMEQLDNCNTTSTACPSPDSFENALVGNYNFIVTISSQLSGAFNSAQIAANGKESSTFVIDSKGAAGIERLIVEKLYELIKKDLSFEEIKTAIIEYRDGLQLYFNLSTYDNLVRKGRISACIAKIISIARIKILCKAKDGNIAMAKKSFTYNQCINTIVSEIETFKSKEKKRKCIISFCECKEFVKKLAEKIKNLNLFEHVIFKECKGLNSFYALKNGIIVSYD